MKINTYIKINSWFKSGLVDKSWVFYLSCIINNNKTYFYWGVFGLQDTRLRVKYTFILFSFVGQISFDFQNALSEHYRSASWPSFQSICIVVLVFSFYSILSSHLPLDIEFIQNTVPAQLFVVHYIFRVTVI